MASSTTPQILLTGATGFIGGTILDHFINSKSPALSGASISVLLRGEDRVAKITSAYGSRVKPILYKDIDDIDAIVASAAQHDVVINTTVGFHPASIQAAVRGLAQRKAATGRDVWLVSTSGTSNFSDTPISKKWVEPENQEFDDAKDDIYGYEKDREVREGPYHQRTAELGAIDLAIELGVKSIIINSPTIYGRGTGLFNKTSVQVPALVRAVLELKKGVVLGDGKGVWDHVHVEDLADLYLLVVERIIAQGGEGVPSGKKGIIFSGNGRHQWLDVAQGVADAAFAEGLIPSNKVESITLAEGRKYMMDGQAPEEIIEKAFISNSRTVSSVARSLGWKPTRGEEAWKQGFVEEVKAELEKNKS
ncbi:NAD(P)-binding protein [Daldinia caldariorum]|uniref:NAD(P)-binding protein n=1 Tax=Daldinia caldariorum TaxID=326644 RepID=UPI00200817D2|nr:NAD(P)-binding protein [Daldinia caldariorum]KAI1470470.1 NAD(P)-binding protein [Daldinia caldariorum]